MRLWTEYGRFPAPWAADPDEPGGAWPALGAGFQIPLLPAGPSRRGGAFGSVSSLELGRDIVSRPFFWGRGRAAAFGTVALERRWAGEADEAALLAGAAALRQRHWRLQGGSEISHVPLGDFPLYDHVLAACRGD